jgi:DNA-binding NtrC family response regulator
MEKLDGSAALELRANADAPAQLATDERAKVLVFASPDAQCGPAMEWLRRESGVCCLMARDRADALAAARSHQPEVAVVELGFDECNGPGLAMQVAAAARHLQAVFFAGRDDEAEMAAARALGLERVFLREELPEVLGRLLVPLAELVRLRRRAEHLEELLRRVPVACAGSSGCGLITLPEGERRYRETYVRALLAETGNRREAARRAGVPYTTLCDMMRKLGIDE